MLVYYSKISKDKHSFLIEQYLYKFSDEYQKKIQSYRRWQDAQLSLLGRILLLRGLEEFEIAEWEIKNIQYDIFGKPYFDFDSFFFNISHSKNIVICAINKNFDVGIDLEYVKDTDVSDFKNQMLNVEWDKINKSNNKMLEFYEYWTQKEAVLKVVGKGLDIPLKSFLIKENQTIINNISYSLQSINVDKNYCCNIAVKSSYNKFINVKTKEIII